MSAMSPIEPPDIHFVNAAQGWLELGHPKEAKKELEQINPRLNRHPLVLLILWNISAKYRDWDVCIEVASTLIQSAPESDQGWIYLGNSYFFSGRIQEAFNRIRKVIDQFPKSDTLRYNLACYACQLGKLDDAKRWLAKAFALGNSQQLKQTALADPDLKPLWKEIAES